MRILLALVATLTASEAVAQTTDKQKEPSIVELAQQEKARREALKDESKVITTDQLGYRSQPPPVSVGVPAAPEEEAAQAESADESEEQPRTEAEIRAEKQAEIQAKVDAEVERMERVREVMAEAQRQLSDLTDLTFGTRRANLQRLIDEGEAELAQSEENLQQLRREARVAGVRVKTPR